MIEDFSHPSDPAENIKEYDIFYPAEERVRNTFRALDGEEDSRHSLISGQSVDSSSECESDSWESNEQSEDNVVCIPSSRFDFGMCQKEPLKVIKNQSSFMEVR